MVMDRPSPQSVGREFVRQYYTLLNQAPLHLHRFYNDESSFVHGGLDNEKDCQPVHGQQEIHQKIMQLNFRDCKAKIRHVDAHATISDGVVVQVSGELSNYGQPMRRFMQTFVLVSQNPKMYYVRNDIFRYQDDIFFEDDDERATQENSMDMPSDSALQPMKHPTIGVDGIATVSINPEVKKESPHINGGHEVLEERNQLAAPDVAAASSDNSPPRQPVNHSPEAEAESSVDAEDQGAETEEHYKDTVDKSEDQDMEQEDPDKQALENEPVNQGPPTYANLVKSGAGVTGSRQSFGKPTTTSSMSTSTAGQQATSGKDAANKEPAQGLGQQSNPAKGTGNRPRQSLGGVVRSGGSGSGNSGGVGGGSAGREKYQKDDGQNHEITTERRRGPAGGGSGPGTIQYPDSQQLFVGNLPHSYTESDLMKFFSKYGKVLEARISSKGANQSKTNPSGQVVPNFAFVVFEDEKSVQDCLKEKPILIDGGYRLNVETKKNKNRSESGQNLSSGGGGGGPGLNRERGSQEHLRSGGGSGRGSDRNRGAPRSGGGRGRGQGMFSSRGGLQGSGPPQGQGPMKGGGGSYTRRS